MSIHPTELQYQSISTVKMQEDNISPYGHGLWAPLWRDIQYLKIIKKEHMSLSWRKKDTKDELVYIP